MNTSRDGQMPPTIALLIDAENTKPDFSDMFKLCKQYGEIKVARIYAKRNLLQKTSWQNEIREWDLRPVYTEQGVENGADMSIIIDAVDILHTDCISTFIIVSTDSDFIPLIRRLRRAGKTVIGISTRYPPRMLRSCFHHFHTILRPEWDVFEFCLHEFYVSYLDCIQNEGWALVDDIILSLSNPERFVQRLQGIGYGSYISFLKDSHWFYLWRDNLSINNKKASRYWVIKRDSRALPEPSLDSVTIMRKYAESILKDKPQFCGSIHTFLNYLNGQK